MTYRDASLPVVERVNDLLSQMSLDEKLAQLYSCWMFDLLDGSHRLAFEKVKAQMP